MPDFNCFYCGNPVDPALKDTWHRIIAWERKGRAGGSDVSVRERYGEAFAHPRCVTDAQKGLAGQSSMFGEPVSELLAEPNKSVEWPYPVYRAALDRFGDVMNNRKAPTRKGLDRKIVHALAVWDDKYGPLNPSQADYAADCLASCFTNGGGQLELPQIYVRLDSIVHHDKVHAGFLRRV